MNRTIPNRFPWLPAGLTGLFILILVFTFIATLPAEVWTSMGPFGGDILGLVADPTTSGTLYAAGRYGPIFKTTDGGSSWHPANHGLQPLFYESTSVTLAIDPSNPVNIYAGGNAVNVYARSNTLYKSSNGGASWTVLRLPPEAGIVNTIAVAPSDSHILYIGTNHGIYKTTDGGTSWTEKNNGITMENDSKWMNVLVFDPVDPNRIYAGTGIGLFLSINGGDRWEPINNGLPFPGLSTLQGVTALAIDPSHPATLYAGAGRVFKSTDRGTNWVPFYTPYQDRTVTAIVIHPRNPDTIYSVLYGMGIAKTLDGGNSWSLTGSEFPNQIPALAMDGNDPGTLYAGSVDRGVLKTMDGGLTWAPTNNGLGNAAVSAMLTETKDRKIFYVGNRTGVYRTQDEGKSWDRILHPSQMDLGSHETGESTSLAIDRQNPATMLVATLQGDVFRTTDGGTHWSQKVWGYLGSVFLVADRQNPMTVYYASMDRYLKSIDGGEHWSSIASPPSKTELLVMDPSNTATLYVGTGGDGVYKTTDGGQTWTQKSTGLTDTGINLIAIDRVHPQILYVATGASSLWSPSGKNCCRVFRSDDSAASWKLVSEFKDIPITALDVAPDSFGTVYLATSGYEAFRSTNGGVSWSRIQPQPSGIGEVPIQNFGFNEQIPDVVYAGTSTMGLLKMGGRTSWDLEIAGGGTAVSATGSGGAKVQNGYAAATVPSGPTPYGTAVFTFRENGITLSEAGVPASPPTSRARIFVEYRKGANAIPGRFQAGTVDVNTGIAVVNPGAATADVTYTLYNIAGTLLATGHGTIAAGQHLVCFLDQLKEKAQAADFQLPSDFPTAVQFGSLEIAGTQPLSVLALRGTMNQRHEFLMTTTPIADLTQTPVNGPGYFPQFVDGGGYTTSLILLNASGAVESGTLEILDNNGAPFRVNAVGGKADSTFRYLIPAGGLFRFQSDGFPAEVKSGWVKLTPDASGPTPVGSGVFGYNPGSILVSESGIPAAASTTHARIYVDLSGKHNTGLAIANPEVSTADITVRAFEADGITPAGTGPGLLRLAAHGHDARFADQLIAGLPDGFTGVLDINSATPFAALTLRSLDNERHEFLMTTFPVADARKTAPTSIVFPQIVNGGGYATQFILLDGGGTSTMTLRLFAEDGTPLPIGQ